LLKAIAIIPDSRTLAIWKYPNGCQLQSVPRQVVESA
jgi:hypothetical protein